MIKSRQLSAPAQFNHGRDYRGVQRAFFSIGLASRLSALALLGMTAVIEI